MKFFKYTYTLVLFLSLLAGCAKVRENTIPGDGNQERIDKSVLTGLAPEKSRDIRKFSDYENRFDPTINPEKGKVWLTKTTVTNISSYGGPLFLGYQSAMKVGYFKFNKDSLDFLSAVNPNHKKDGKLDDLIFTWDVEHSEYRYLEVDGRPTNSLEEDEYIPWYNKSKFTVDWARDQKIETNLEDLGDCWEKVSEVTLQESRVFEKDYFSFTKRISYAMTDECGYDLRRMTRGHTTFQAEFTYSFKQLKSEDTATKYKPYVYNGEFDPLIQKYGYFKSVFEERSLEDDRLRANFLMDRWNPKKVHTFYFAPGFPQEYKWLYKTDPTKKDPYGRPAIGIIDRTNEVLKKAGVKMRFEIKDAPEGVRFGDVRYSFIKFMQEPNGSSPLGYGPSDPNPFTGEIVSANSMVWTGDLKYYVQLIEEYVKRSDSEEGSAQSFYAEMSKVMETENDDNFLKSWLETSKDLQPETEVGDVFKKMLTDFTYAPTFWAPFTVGYEVDDEGLISLPAEEADIFEFKDLKRLESQFGNYLGKKGLLDLLESASKFGKESIRQIKNIKNKYDMTIYQVEPEFSGIQEQLIEGKTPQQIIDNILYRVAIHEFGHNINLRHNFYGSMDTNNMSEPNVLTVKKEDGSTETRVYNGVTSSVMEYMNLSDELHDTWDWEAYDRAAITYAYTGGKIDHANDVYPKGHPQAGEKKHFLYCTDEHRYFNALCNVYDKGDTPSEIVLSMIDNYQKAYFVNNRRFGRAYWDTRGYESRIFRTMWDIKKFFMLDQTAITTSNRDLSDTFKKLNISKNEESKYLDPIKKDIRRAVKISIAFYNSVLQQSSVERPYFSEYDEPTGALLRKGIFADKLFATMFLLGDETFTYNPNIPISYASYLDYDTDPDVGNAVKKVAENLLTVRVDSEPGFINYARLMYADSATNYYNQNNVRLANRFKVNCYTPERFTKFFGINPYQYVPENETEPSVLVADIRSVLTLPESAQLEFTEFVNELSDIGFAFVDGRVYVASKTHNEISFNVIKYLRQNYIFGDGDSSDRIGLRKQDLRDLRYLYKAVTGTEDNCL